MAPWIGVGARPVIGYAPGTRGMADRWAPSRLFSEGIEYEGLGIEGLLQRGYAVAMPDYEGLGTAGIHTLPVQEVAETVGAPVGTVRARLGRGRAALAELLSDRETDEHPERSPR